MTPLLCTPCMYAPIYSQYISFVKFAIQKNANKNTDKILLDSLHKLPSILLKMSLFLAQFSSEFMFYEECCRGGSCHATGICWIGWAHRKLGIVCPVFSFFNKIHYRNKLDKYIYNFHYIKEPYLVRLGPNGSFSVPASMACAIKIMQLGSASRGGQMKNCA